MVSFSKPAFERGLPMDWIDCGSSFSLATLRFGANRHGAKNCHVLTRLTIVLLFSQARGVFKNNLDILKTSLPAA